MHKQFFISGNVPSSKNSKRWTGKTLIWSALATKYVKNTKEQWESMSEEFSSLFNNINLIQPKNSCLIKKLKKIVKNLNNLNHFF